MANVQWLVIFTNCCVFLLTVGLTIIDPPVDGGQTPWAAEERCVTNDSCRMDNSVCVNETCHCLPPFSVPVANVCTEAVGLGGSCNFTEQCTAVMENSCCKNNVCMCPENAIPSSDRCIDRPIIIPVAVGVGLAVIIVATLAIYFFRSRQKKA